jgi:hypothetical protein
VDGGGVWRKSGGETMGIGTLWRARAVIDNIALSHRPRGKKKGFKERDASFRSNQQSEMPKSGEVNRRASPCIGTSGRRRGRELRG